MATVELRSVKVFSDMRWRLRAPFYCLRFLIIGNLQNFQARRYRIERHEFERIQAVSCLVESVPDVWFKVLRVARRCRTVEGKYRGTVFDIVSQRSKQFLHAGLVKPQLVKQRIADIRRHTGKVRQIMSE